MLQIKPFRGIHFDWKRVRLGAVLSPPYDVISSKLGRQLRSLPHNTIHLELPLGDNRTKYRHAREIWKRWERGGWLVRDMDAAYYVIEQKFVCEGRSYRRTGLLAALHLNRDGIRRVTPHEKTLSKPKKDRLNLLRSLRANTSPIFALYPDSGGALRRYLSRITRRSPDISGNAPGRVQVRVWKVGDSAMIRAIEAAFRAKQLMVADGHHRLEVAKKFGSSSILCYLCAQEDPGLLVLPTHRVVASGDAVLNSVDRQCRVKIFGSRNSLEKALTRHSSPLAFGVVSSRSIQSLKERGRGRGKRIYSLAVPSSASSSRLVRSGLSVEWLSTQIFGGLDPQAIRYTHDAREAERSVVGETIAVLVKPVGVRDIFRAVRKVGLLPQKSTYFYPKVEAGVVFNPVESSRGA